MGSENEPAKLLLPYLQRADELQKHELLVAYYCRLYAMERGLKIPQKDRTKTTNAILVSLMNQLEKDRKTLKLGPEDHLYIEGFASNVFAKADKQDRAGRADLNTAKTFYAASIFFEILNQFGEIQPDLEQKQKYAVWKAADIRKALKEGRKPVPGPPGGDKDLSEPSNSPNTAYDLGPSDNISASHQGTGAEVPSQFHEMGNYQSSGNTQTSPPSNPAGMSRSSSFNPTSEFSPDDFNTHPPPINRQESSSYPQPYQHQTYQPEPPQPPTNTQENSSYPQTYHHQTYQPEQPPQAPPNIHENSSYPQPPHHQTFQPEFQHIPPQNFPSHDLPPSSYSLPNFQSYPGFSDHSLPSAPTHTPYYQAPDPSYTQQSAPSVLNYQSSAPIGSTSRNGTPAETGATSSQTFHYDVNYQPPPEKIAEAHKAARFAVGALAFDDVTVAVDFLRKSLELLTNPSASH